VAQSARVVDRCRARGAQDSRRDYAGFRSQFLRAAKAIPAAIVEGRGRDNDPEFARYVGIAIGEAYEVEYHLIDGRERGLISEAEYIDLTAKLDEVRRMLYGLRRKLRDDIRRAQQGSRSPDPVPPPPPIPTGAPAQPNQATT
jgi:four helix bundle protein